MTDLVATLRRMRIATWNCQGGLDKKMDVVGHLNADVLIVQECAESTDLSNEPGISSTWSPPYDDATKGVGVFCRGPWSVVRCEPVSHLPWMLPVTVMNQDSGRALDVLAIWTNKNKDDGRPPYAEQFGEVLGHIATSTTLGSTVIAGDLNASMQGPSVDAHARNLETLHSLGFVSVYHDSNGIGHGHEREMTLKWIGPGKREYLYHCDFIFVPRELAVDAVGQVVNTFNWPTRVSDHQPVVVDLDI